MVTEHQVRERAYHIWEVEGRVAGRDEAYWLRAEAELRTVAAHSVVETSRPAAAKAASKPTASRAKAPKTVKAAAPKVAKAKRPAEGVALH